jgi:hypothetical protein
MNINEEFHVAYIMFNHRSDEACDTLLDVLTRAQKIHFINDIAEILSADTRVMNRAIEVLDEYYNDLEGT